VDSVRFVRLREERERRERKKREKPFSCMVINDRPTTPNLTMREVGRELL